jgi:hypothetical protein
MNHNDDRNVRIRIAIDVPLAGGAPRVDFPYVGGPPAPFPAPAPHAPQPSAYGTIDRPGTYAKVRIDPSTGMGYICAEGDTSAGGTCACAVFANVFKNFSDVPLCVPGDARVGKILPYGMRWQFKDADELPGVIDTGMHTFAIWMIFEDGTWQRFTRPFTPTGDGTETDCTSSQAAPPSMPLLTTIARAWRLHPRAFAGQVLSAFNRAWTLQLARPVDAGALFDNGADGNHQPRVELRTCTAAKPRWLLTFVLAGRSVQYAMAAEDFQLCGANTFSQARALGDFGEETAVPPTITLFPA